MAKDIFELPGYRERRSRYRYCTRPVSQTWLPAVAWVYLGLIKPLGLSRHKPNSELLPKDDRYVRLFVFLLAPRTYEDVYLPRCSLFQMTIPTFQAWPSKTLCTELFGSCAFLSEGDSLTKPGPPSATLLVLFARTRCTTKSILLRWMVSNHVQRSIEHPQLVPF
ncbi:hypothetical protein EV421DRAFT_1434279 [Armillaria borealis]|uniref:Uncharacterized protein n=1 Tax=Armillaria borealis TaxID=47425 RepID=A0AA39J0W0_9AGAR|nr:hypothetical protein EV421DRAFT_1434279 [Armillaria borealis]